MTVGPPADPTRNVGHTRPAAIQTIGIVSPGAMGSALARAWASGGARVVATVADRSARTAILATGLELLPDLASVVSTSDLVVSICPPAASDDVLVAVLDAARATDVAPLLLDANAVSPDRVQALERRASRAGIDLVDGSVSGGPPAPGGDTVLYLSGARAAEVADLPAVGLRRSIVGERVGDASAVKMCTASVYKGTTAVWAQALQTAHSLGVLRPVLEDLAEEFPAQVEGAGRRLAVAAAKSARFVDEMESIARTQQSAGASPELFDAMAAVYRRLSATRLAALSPEEASALTDLRDVLGRLT